MGVVGVLVVHVLVAKFDQQCETAVLAEPALLVLLGLLVVGYVLCMPPGRGCGVLSRVINHHFADFGGQEQSSASTNRMESQKDLATAITQERHRDPFSQLRSLCLIRAHPLICKDDSQVPKIRYDGIAMDGWVVLSRCGFGLFEGRNIVMQ